MKPLNNPIVQEASAAMQAALKAGDENALAAAFENFTNAVMESIRNDYEMAHNDNTILAQRGYRVLTAKEQQF